MYHPRNNRDHLPASLRRGQIPTILMDQRFYVTIVKHPLSRRRKHLPHHPRPLPRQRHHQKKMVRDVKCSIDSAHKTRPQSGGVLTSTRLSIMRITTRTIPRVPARQSIAKLSNHLEHRINAGTVTTPRLVYIQRCLSPKNVAVNGLIAWLSDEKRRPALPTSGNQRRPRKASVNGPPRLS